VPRAAVSPTRSAPVAAAQKEVPPWQARLAVAGPAAFALLVVLVDVLQYDWLISVGHSPWRTSPVSVNTWGPYGWIQVVAFAVAGASVVALTRSLHRVTAGPGRSVLSLVPLGVMGLAFLGSAAPCDCGGGLQPASAVPGLVHTMSFFALMLALLIAPFAMWRRLHRVPGWRRQATWSLLTGVAALPLFPAAAVLSSGDAVHAPVFYLFLAVVPLQWLTTMAVPLLRRTRNHAGEEVVVGAR
jgi:hypothetical protein